MKLKNAMHRLFSFGKWGKPDPDDYLTDSVQLGYQAIKRIRWYRAKFGGIFNELLPGETEE